MIDYYIIILTMAHRKTVFVDAYGNNWRLNSGPHVGINAIEYNSIRYDLEITSRNNLKLYKYMLDSGLYSEVGPGDSQINTYNKYLEFKKDSERKVDRHTLLRDVLTRPRQTPVWTPRTQPAPAQPAPAQPVPAQPVPTQPAPVPRMTRDSIKKSFELIKDVKEKNKLLTVFDHYTDKQYVSGNLSTDEYKLNKEVITELTQQSAPQSGVYHTEKRPRYNMRQEAIYMRST
jgi:hypothetical protein